MFNLIIRTRGQHLHPPPFMVSVYEVSTAEPGVCWVFNGVSQSVISSEETGSVCRPQLFTFPSDRHVCLHLEGQTQTHTQPSSSL